jgi:hypothetical protein
MGTFQAAAASNYQNHTPPPGDTKNGHAHNQRGAKTGKGPKRR